MWSSPNRDPPGRVQTCTSLYRDDTPLPVLACSPRTVSKQAVCILLECLLVLRVVVLARFLPRSIAGSQFSIWSLYHIAQSGHRNIDKQNYTIALSLWNSPRLYAQDTPLLNKSNHLFCRELTQPSSLTTFDEDPTFIYLSPAWCC